MSKPLDKHYHDKKLRLVLRDLSAMPADEYARALIRLANVADDSVICEPEFAKLRAELEPVAFYWQDVGSPEAHRHGPYFGWPDDGALLMVKGTAVPVPLYAAQQQNKSSDECKLVPIEPTAGMLDVAVSHALMVSLSGDYNWSAYMRDVWLRMLAAAPSAPKADDSDAANYRWLREQHNNVNSDIGVYDGPNILATADGELDLDAAIAAARKGEGE